MQNESRTGSSHGDVQEVNLTVGVNRTVCVNRTVNTGINYGPSCYDQGAVMYVANEAPPSYINETQSRNRMPYSKQHEASRNAKLHLHH